MAAPPALKLPFRQSYASASERTFFRKEDVDRAFGACFDRLERQYPGRWEVQQTHVFVDQYLDESERVMVTVVALIRHDREDDLTPEEP